MDDVRILERTDITEIRLRTTRVAGTALKATAVFWFLMAVIGQWAFVYYMAAFYGGAAVQGDLERWSEATIHGYVAGDTIGNVAFAMHIVLGVVVTFGGSLQLVPRLRDRAPLFHRWNGRIYLLAVFAVAIDGLYLVYVRGIVGGVGSNIAISINAVLMMLFGAMALRHALARDFATHRRWALRLFLTVNGVWFFRVGMMFWILVNRGPVGFDPETFTGPFITLWGFGQYLLPLAVLEIYLRVKERPGAPGRFAMAGGLFVLTLAMGVGIVGAFMGMWLPRL